jgi:hypothetical protein
LIWRPTSRLWNAGSSKKWRIKQTIWGLFAPAAVSRSNDVPLANSDEALGFFDADPILLTDQAVSRQLFALA